MANVFLSRLFGAVVLSFVVIVCSGCATPSLQDLTDGQKINAKISRTNYSLEVAKTQQAQEKGLSNLRKLDKNSGMIFVFDEPGYNAFWMKDTYIPLTVIWLNEDLEIVDRQNMNVEDDPANPQISYSPISAAKYAIEINQSTNIKVGQTVDISY